jgi:hypothetical protein
LVAIILIAACVWYLYPAGKSVGILVGKEAAGVSDEHAISEQMDATPKLLTDDTPSEVPTTSFPKALQECFPDLAGKIDSSKQYIDHWKAQHPSRTPRPEFVHYFFKNKSGQDMRAQILYTYTDGRTVREFKLFRVLADGLPDPVDVPEGDSYNPTDAVLNKYIDFNTVFETQKKWTSTGAPQDHLEVEESNEQITEFQLFQNDIAFRCHESDCECRKKN